MALNNDEIRVAGNGRVYIAPKGTTLPTDLTALPADWIDLGALSEDGATISRSVDQETVSIWQSPVPARYLITGTEVELGMTLMQFNSTTLPLYFGGGEVTPSGTAPNTVYTYEIPMATDIDERAMVIEAFDGTLTYRFGFPRVQVKETDELALKRTEASGLALTFGVMAPGDDAPLGVVITNDQNWAAA